MVDLLKEFRVRIFRRKLRVFPIPFWMKVLLRIDTQFESFVLMLACSFHEILLLRLMMSVFFTEFVSGRVYFAFVLSRVVSPRGQMLIVFESNCPFSPSLPSVVIL